MDDFEKYYSLNVDFYKTLSSEQLIAIALDKMNVVFHASEYNPKITEITDTLMTALIRSDMKFTDAEKEFCDRVDEIYDLNPKAVPLRFRAFDFKNADVNTENAFKMFKELNRSEKALIIQLLLVLAAMDYEISKEEKDFIFRLADCL